MQYYFRQNSIFTRNQSNKLKTRFTMKFSLTGENHKQLHKLKLYQSKSTAIDLYNMKDASYIIILKYI